MRIAAAMGMLAATAAFLATGPGGHAEGAVGASSGAGFFTSACGYSHSGPDDPIVKPGRPGGTHMHDFLGNESTDAHATLGSLHARGTRCRRAGDRSAYWVPSLVRRGRRIAPRGRTFTTARRAAGPGASGRSRRACGWWPEMPGPGSFRTRA